MKKPNSVYLTEICLWRNKSYARRCQEKLQKFNLFTTTRNKNIIIVKIQIQQRNS